jgi:hypothetical protein
MSNPFSAACRIYAASVTTVEPVAELPVDKSPTTQAHKGNEARFFDEDNLRVMSKACHDHGAIAPMSSRAWPTSTRCPRAELAPLTPATVEHKGETK